MDKPTEKVNNNETDENNKSDLISTTKEIAREHSSNPIQQLDSLNCLGNSYYGDEGGNNNNNNNVNETSDFSSTLNNNSTNLKSPVTPLKNIKADLVESRRLVSKGYNTAKPLLHTTTSPSPSSNSITRKILTNGSLTHHNNHHDHGVHATSNMNNNNKNDNSSNNTANNIITPYASSPSDCINSLNYESAENELTNSIIHDNYMMNDVVVVGGDDGEADGDGDVNHLKKLKSAQKTEHKSLWKRSSFGSLTRRSSSVSKTLQRNNFNGFNQSDHDENKRLVISRPVLLSRPNSITQTSLNKLPSNFSSSSIIGGLTEPSSLVSSTSRGSSLAVVSSSNGCSGGGIGGCDSSNGGYASSVNNVQEELLAHSLNTDFDQGQQQQQQQHQQQPLSSASSCYYEVSTNASLSPAPSLSSMTSVSGGLPHSLTSSIISTQRIQIMLVQLRIQPIYCLILLLHQLPRIQNLSPSATLVNLSAKNVCDTGVLSSSPTSCSSSSLLRNKSKLLFNRDIYQPSSQMSPSHSVFSAVTNPLQHEDLTRIHGSHLSSSSSSSISSPTTTAPFAYDSNGQYSQKSRDFADFLNKDINISESSSSTSSKAQMSTTRIGLDAQSNLYRSPFKSSLSRLPRGGSQRDNNNNGDNGEDVLAI
ncbi:unnamed protein product [Trichobilharzia szidati]|nr:unnamed protein product [Trichobilharzia szidati]